MPAKAGEGIRQQAQAEGDGWRFPPFPLEALGIVADEDVLWVGRRLSPQPLKTYEEPVRLPPGEWERVPRTYVFCTGRAFGGSSSGLPLRQAPIPARTGSTFTSLTRP